MRIIVLNGSPRPKGSTKQMVDAFREGAESAGHRVDVIDVCKKKIAGCLACEYCHTKGEGRCIQQDDMQEVYPVLAEAEMIVLASPVDSRNRCANPVIRFAAPCAFSQKLQSNF